MSQEVTAKAEELVLVPGKDSEELVSVNDLVGYWYNQNAQGSFNAIQSRNTPKYVWLKQGQVVEINDDWVKDYATGMTNARWHVVGNKLYVYQPEIGLQHVDVKRVGKTMNYTLTINNVLYQRKVNLTGMYAITD